MPQLRFISGQADDEDQEECPLLKEDCDCDCHKDAEDDGPWSESPISPISPFSKRRNGFGIQMRCMRCCCWRMATPKGHTEFGSVGIPPWRSDIILIAGHNEAPASPVGKNDASDRDKFDPEKDDAGG